ncbi:MAG: hypothetical protein IJX63_09485 [Lachnospiraceae bacterium]|nr:hypothetical protein [Lachnospiraceae bacterium]
MKNFLLWQYMLNKRLLHKKVFVLLLCLVPILVWGMGRIAREDSGIMTILLSLENPQDALARQIVEEVLQDDSILYYEVVEPDRAYELVEAGQADCAWILREDFEEKLISTFAEGMDTTAPVYVVAKEDTVALQLARTKLYAFVYPHLARRISEQYVATQVGIAEEEHLTEELQTYYEENKVESSLFQMVYADAAKRDNTSQAEVLTEQSYLMLPIRGILVIFVLVCGLVVTLYYLQDEERGMFAWIPVSKRRGALYCYLFAAGIDVSVVVALALWISEGSLISLRELGILVLYLPMMAVFCELMSLFCRKSDTLAKWIPLLCLAMLGLCPVFLDLGSGFALQYLFPPTYYLRALYSNRMLGLMVGYTVVLFVAETVSWRVVQKQEIY